MASGRFQVTVLLAFCLALGSGVWGTISASSLSTDILSHKATISRKVSRCKGVASHVFSACISSASSPSSSFTSHSLAASSTRSSLLNCTTLLLVSDLAFFVSFVELFMGVSLYIRRTVLPTTLISIRPCMRRRLSSHK